MSLLKGSEFNRQYNDGTKFAKLTYESEKHNGMQYQDGLNVDIEPFLAYNYCKGGMYFCRFDKMEKWLFYGKEPIWWFREVEIPDDAKVYIEGDNKFKADKLILKPRKPIEDMPNYEEICIRKISADSGRLRCIKHKTESIIIAALRKDGHAIQNIDNPTVAMVEAAVGQNSNSFADVKNQTPELCLAAVKRDGQALEHVIFQTPELCLAAVSQDGQALEYVKEQTPEICSAAIKQDYHAIYYLNPKFETTELSLYVVNQSGMLIEYIKNRTPEICLAAVKNNGQSIMYLRDITPELSLEAVKENGLALRYIKNQTREICLTALQQNKDAIKYLQFDALNSILDIAPQISYEVCSTGHVTKIPYHKNTSNSVMIYLESKLGIDIRNALKEDFDMLKFWDNQSICLTNDYYLEKLGNTFTLYYHKLNKGVFYDSVDKEKIGRIIIC